MSPMSEGAFDLHIDKFFIGLKLDDLKSTVEVQAKFTDGYRHLDALFERRRPAPDRRADPGRAQALKGPLPDMPGEESADRRIYLAFIDKISQRELLRQTSLAPKAPEYLIAEFHKGEWQNFGQGA